MQFKRLSATVIALISILAAFAQEKTEAPWKRVNATELRIINKGFDDSERTFSRLPKYLKDSIRQSLWDRQNCSAGMGVRFATNSSRIGVRYQLLVDSHMNHMADTGIKGTDLYIFEGDSVWRHAATIRPVIKDKENKIIEDTFISNLDTTKMTEYMVYLPLYDGVLDYEIKVDSLAEINEGRSDIIDRKRKIVAYGTSIMQGGCASRTGMTSSNILGRELNCEVVNLGFSGDGKMDDCVARAMVSIPDVDLFLIDPVPNCTAGMCDTLTYDFINIFRKARPEVPVVMVENPHYTFVKYDSYYRDYIPLKNSHWRRNYERLIAENPENLYYIDCVNLDGPENDGTVDGLHLTDLGFRRYVDKVRPVLEAILNKQQ